MSHQPIGATRLLPAAIIALSACSAPTEAPVEVPPSFTAQVTGGANHTVRGHARFSADAVGDGYGFAIMLTEPVTGDTAGKVRHAIYLYRAQPGGPTEGEFRVIESRDVSGAQATDFVAGAEIYANETNGLSCRANTGTVRLKPRVDGRLLGTFTMSARCQRIDGIGTDDPIEVTGSFEAEDAIVALPEPGPSAAGSYTLADVEGQPLPAIVSIGVDEGQWFEVTAASGGIAIDATGHYEQTVTLEGRTDGKLTSRWRWVDRGVCRLGSGVHLACTSEYLQNVAFGAVVSASAVEILQDVVGDGVYVRYRYRRVSSP